MTVNVFRDNQCYSRYLLGTSMAYIYQKVKQIHISSNGLVGLSLALIFAGVTGMVCSVVYLLSV